MKLIFNITIISLITYQLFGLTDSANWSLYLCLIFYTSLTAISFKIMLETAETFYLVTTIIFLFFTIGTVTTNEITAFENLPRFWIDYLGIFLYLFYGAFRIFKKV